MLTLYLIFAVFAESKSINDFNNLSNATENKFVVIKPDNNSDSTLVLEYIFGKKAAFNGSVTVPNATTGSSTNSNKDKLFATFKKRVVEDSRDFEVATSTKEQNPPTPANTTEHEMSKMAEKVADDLTSGMLFGNAFLLDKWMMEEPFGLPSSLVQKKDVRNITSDVPAANHSMPHLMKRFSLMRKFLFY